MNSGNSQAANAPSHNKALANAFLTSIDPNAEKFSFQFSYDRSGCNNNSNRVFYVPLDVAWSAVEEMNTPAKSVGVFVYITDSTGQRSRVRLPGTLNLENPDAPRLVQPNGAQRQPLHPMVAAA